MSLPGDELLVQEVRLQLRQALTRLVVLLFQLLPREEGGGGLMGVGLVFFGRTCRFGCFEDLRLVVLGVGGDRPI